MRSEDVPYPIADHNKVLVRQVAEAHTEVMEDVSPLPAGLGGDGADAVHQVVKDAVQARGG